MPRRNKTNNQKGISVNPIKRGDKLGRVPLVAEAAAAATLLLVLLGWSEHSGDAKFCPP